MLSDLSAAIYGTMTVGALLAAESAENETYFETVVAVLITLVIYWFAHSYAEFASERLKEREPLRLAPLGRIMVRQVPILFGAAIPLVAVLVLWAADASLSTAVTAAVWTSAATVAAIEILAGVRADRTGRELAFQSLFGCLLGLLIILLRLTLH
jgi:hypothetical protein